MPLLISESDTFKISVKYNYKPNGEIEFKEDGKESAVFVFKRPNWIDIRTIMSTSVIVNANNGQAIIDPYKLMDTKIKILLKSWDLKGEKGEIELTNENVDKLHPELIQYLFDKMNAELSPTSTESAPTETTK